MANRLILTGQDVQQGLSRTIVKELLTDGQNVSVTESNKAEYVLLMKSWLARGR